MNKLNEVKLAIYEKCNRGEITNDECKILLEKAEERYAFDTELTEDEKIAVECVLDGSMTLEEVLDLDESDEEMTVEESEETIGRKIDKVANEASNAIKRHTKTIKIMNEAKNQYKENEKKIKTLIKDGEYQEAKKIINKCESSIKVIKSSIESIKDKPSDAVVDFVFNTGKFFVMSAVLDGILNYMKISTIEDNGTTVKSNFKPSITGSATDAAVYGAYKKLTNDTWNTTKANALKTLNKRLMVLKRLSNKISKLEKKTEK